MQDAVQRLRAYLHELLEHIRSHPNPEQIDMALVLTALEALGDEVALIEAQLPNDTATAVAALAASDQISASTALSSALSTADVSASTAVSSALSTQEADNQAALNSVTSSLSSALSQLAVTAGVSSSTSGVSSSLSAISTSSSVSAVSTSLSAVSTSLSAVSTSLSASVLSVSPTSVETTSGTADSFPLSIRGGTAPYSIPDLGQGQTFDPSTDTLSIDATALPGSGVATIQDSASPPNTAPLTVTVT